MAILAAVQLLAETGVPWDKGDDVKRLSKTESKELWSRAKGRAYLARGQSIELFTEEQKGETNE